MSRETRALRGPVPREVPYLRGPVLGRTRTWEGPYPGRTCIWGGLVRTCGNAYLGGPVPWENPYLGRTRALGGPLLREDEYLVGPVPGRTRTRVDPYVGKSVSREYPERTRTREASDPGHSTVVGVRTRYRDGLVLTVERGQDTLYLVPPRHGHLYVIPYCPTPNSGPARPGVSVLQRPHGTGRSNPKLYGRYVLMSSPSLVVL